MNIKILLADNNQVKRDVAYFNVMDKPSNYEVIENEAYIINLNTEERAANIVTLKVKGGGKIYSNETHKEIRDEDEPFEIIRKATFNEMHMEQLRMDREEIELWKSFEA